MSYTFNANLIGKDKNKFSKSNKEFRFEKISLIAKFGNSENIAKKTDDIREPKLFNIDIKKLSNPNNLKNLNISLLSIVAKKVYNNFYIIHQIK